MRRLSLCSAGNVPREFGGRLGKSRRPDLPFCLLSGDAERGIPLAGRNVFSSLPTVPTPVRTVGAGESAAVTPLPSADALSGGDAFVRNAADESF